MVAWFRCRIPHSCYHPPQNGKVYSKEVAKPTEPSKDEVIRTYKELAEPILKKDEIDRSLDMMLNLEKLEDVTQLMDILRAE